MAKSYKKNIVYNSIYRIVVIITPLITSPYIARVLGATNLGVYTYCNAFAIYFVICAMLGVNDYGNRSIAKSRDDIDGLSDCFWQIYYLQAFLAIISTIIYIISIAFINTDYRIVRLILIAYVITSLFDINWFAFGLEEFKFTSVRNIIIRLGIVAGIFIFVRTENDIPAYTAVLVFGNLISTLPVWILVTKRTKFRGPDYKAIVKHLKPNLILFLPVIAATVYQQMDKLMLGGAGMESEVGYYQNAENIVTLPTFLTTSIVTVMLPHISNLMTKGKNEESVHLMRKSLHYSTILNIAMAFGIAAIANEFIPWFLGPGYERSAMLVRIISPIIVIGGISSVVRYEYLIPKEMDKTFTISIILGAVVNVVLNAILIPNYKADGAAIATIIAYVMVMIYQMIFSHKEVKYGSFFIKIIPYIIIGIVMFAVIEFINSSVSFGNAIEVLIDIFVGACIYLVGSIIILSVTKDSILSDIKKRLTH